ncbi:MAG: ABC transporter ATP-binding protein [Planctomycetes bacterium]|nr:ABC transporter ATP-binding protein [Planctomycetota bacterium]
MSDPVLEVRGLTKRYGAVEALKGFDLTVGRGSIYGFIGPNGAGKTTTIRIVAGLVRPTSGEVRLHGVDLRRNRLAAARGLRTLVEVPAFYPGLSGRQNLTIFARLSGADDADVKRLLARVRLEHAQDRRVGGYSLGMRQRLGIAQALLGRPDLVVLDEPMNGLDPAGMHEMRELIREENRERGVTFFLSSHLLDDIQRLCDRIGILHKGRLVAEGRIDDLLSSAVTGFRLRCERPPDALAALARALPEAKARLDGDGTIHADGDTAVLPRLHHALLAAGHPVVELYPVRASLEAYFLDLTEGVMG